MKAAAYKAIALFSMCFIAGVALHLGMMTVHWIDNGITKTETFYKCIDEKWQEIPCDQIKWLLTQ